MLHLHPDLVHINRFPKADDPDRTKDTIFSYPVAQLSLNGVTGTPSQATREEGENLFHEMVASLSKKIAAAICETPPLGPEYWADIPAVRYD